MSTPAAPYNYAIDAVARSGGSAPQNMFAPAKADNLPTSITCATVSVVVENTTFTPLPASIFSAGSGLYHLYCNGPGTYDVCSTGSVVISGGLITSANGFNQNTIQSVTSTTVGTPATIVAVTLLGTNLYQNSGAAQTYICQAIKIAN